MAGATHTPVYQSFAISSTIAETILTVPSNSWEASGKGWPWLLHDYFTLLYGAKISVSVIRLFNPCNNARGRVGDACHRDSMGGKVVNAAVFFGVDEVFLFLLELVWCGVHV